jgi:hypothetical protein
VSRRNRRDDGLGGYARHAEVYGTEGVFETARAELDADELTVLARRLRALDARWRPPAGFVPAPSPGGRSCPVCGVVLTGRTDRRTCSDACRSRLGRRRDPGEVPDSEKRGREPAFQSGVSVTNPGSGTRGTSGVAKCDSGPENGRLV